MTARPATVDGNQTGPSLLLRGLYAKFRDLNRVLWLGWIARGLPLSATWYRRPQVWIALGVFLVAVGVYQATTSPDISFWDCGEYITTSHILGIPHQPGTPLYVLMGRVFDIVLGSPDVDGPAFKTAAAVNFMSVLFSALALMLLYLIIANIARRADPDSGWLADVGGVVGAFFLLFSETFWNNAIEAEVYGLAAFMICLLTWLTLRWYDACAESRSNRLLYLMIYLLGLGVGFHLGSLLVYPGLFVMVLLARKRRLPLPDLLLMSAGLGLFLLSTMIKQNMLLMILFIAYAGIAWIRAMSGRSFVVIGSGLFLLGLTVHLMMLFRAPLDPAINQSQPDTFGALMSVLRREQYPPINVFERQADLLWQFKYYYNFFIEQFYFLGNGRDFLSRTATFLGPVFLGLLGIFHGIRRARPWIYMLLTNYLINADGLTLYLNFTDHEVRERDYFYFAAFLFFTVFIGLGTAALLRIAAGPEGKTLRELAAGEKPLPLRIGWLPKIAAGLLLLIAAWPLLQPQHVKWYEHDRSQNIMAREYAWNLLAGLDEGAIVFTNGDNDTFPVWYLQEVEKFRPDVTVVNLSLINLPWYIKQMGRRDPPMPLNYSEAEIDRLRARIYEDPRSGQQTIIYVRDYVVHDIVTINARSDNPRPIFFAVTIPQENMARYFPHLQMEGLAYRLIPEASEDGNPTVDGERLMHNMLGIYDYDGVLEGDSDQRRRRYAELSGWRHDIETSGKLGPQGELDLPYEELLATAGPRRGDVFRDTNQRNLLGNYPVALWRAAYSFLHRAQIDAPADSQAYEKLVDKALMAFELARYFDPYFEPVVGLYPIVLVDRNRSEEALEFLSELPGRVSLQAEERGVYETLTSMTQVGEADQAISWLRQRLFEEPDRQFLYNLLFRIYQHLGDLDGCEGVRQRWREQFGAEDPVMEQAVREMRERSLRREQERIDGAVRGEQ